MKRLCPSKKEIEIQRKGKKSRTEKYKNTASDGKDIEYARGLVENF